MVLRAPWDLVADEVSAPRPDPRQVLVRMTHSGICGTDFKIYSGAIPVSYPRIMGHEMVGEVAGSGGGAALRSFRPGDRVIIDPELYCGVCFHCRIGQTHLCPKGILLGRDANGGFAEYVARTFGAKVVGLTISREQRDFAQKRIQAAGLNDQVEIRLQDYRDIAEMLRAGVGLATGLAAAREMFGPNFQPSESLKAMVYFEDRDLRSLTKEEKSILVRAVSAVRELPPVTKLSDRLGA